MYVPENVQLVYAMFVPFKQAISVISIIINEKETNVKKLVLLSFLSCAIDMKPTKDLHPHSLEMIEIYSS